MLDDTTNNLTNICVAAGASCVGIGEYYSPVPRTFWQRLFFAQIMTRKTYVLSALFDSEVVPSDVEQQFRQQIDALCAREDIRVEWALLPIAYKKTPPTPPPPIKSAPPTKRKRR